MDKTLSNPREMYNNKIKFIKKNNNKKQIKVNINFDFTTYIEK